MHPVTITLEHLMMTIPVLTGIYVVAYNKAWLWKKKRSLFHVGLALLSLASVAGIARSELQGEQARLEARLEERRTQLRLQREKQPHLVSLTECKDPKQLELPGEWWNLYQSLVKTSYWEVKLSGIEAFAINYTITDVPPLPIAGFNLICSDIAVKGSYGRTMKHIKRAKKALEPYFSPFNAQPTCVVKAEPTPNEKESQKGKGETPNDES